MKNILKFEDYKDLILDIEKGKRGGEHLTDQEVNQLNDILSPLFRLTDKWTDLIEIDPEKLNKPGSGNPFFKGPKFRIVTFQRKRKPQMSIGITKQPDDWYIVSMNYFKDVDGDWTKPFKCKGFDRLLDKVKELYKVNKDLRPY